MKKKAILSVCFGTQNQVLEQNSISLLEKEYDSLMPGTPVYRATTNEALIKLSKENDSDPVYAVREVLARMVLDGITHVYVQPAYLLHGTEYEELLDMVYSHKADFIEVKCGEPLLASQDDLEETARALMSQYDNADKNDAFCFVGHGSHHYTNAIYCALDYCLKDLGYDRSHIATFNAYPMIDKVIEHLKKQSPNKVHIAPFMFVAGSSALDGVLGDGKDSMATAIRNAGFDVIPNERCLGEYPEIRKIFLNHLKAIID